MPDRITRTKAITKTAGRWARFARAAGARFDVERKAASSVAFAERAGGSSFAIPSKLVGTKPRRQLLERLQKAEPWQCLDLGHDEEGQLGAYWFGVLVGYVQPKHDAWLLPLLSTGRLSCYVLEVSGTAHRMTLGCNIVLTGIAEALIAAEAPCDRAHRVLGIPAIAN